MARTSDHRPNPWAAFAAGAVAMLALALIWAAWFGGRMATGSLLDTAAGVAARTPHLPIPRLPQAPRLPDAPTPMPK